MQYTTLHFTINTSIDLFICNISSASKLSMIRLHHILKSLEYLMYLREHCAPRMQVYLWVLVSLKLEQEAEPSAIRLLSCGTIFQIWSRGQTPCLHLRVGLKLSFLIKLIVRAGQACPGPAPSLCCYRLRLPGDSHDALSSSLLLPLSLSIHPSISINIHVILMHSIT